MAADTGGAATPASTRAPTRSVLCTATGSVMDALSNPTLCLSPGAPPPEAPAPLAPSLAARPSHVPAGRAPAPPRGAPRPAPLRAPLGRCLPANYNPQQPPRPGGAARRHGPKPRARQNPSAEGGGGGDSSQGACPSRRGAGLPQARPIAGAPALIDSRSPPAPPPAAVPQPAAPPAAMRRP